MKNSLLIFAVLIYSWGAYAQDIPSDLIMEDPNDLEILSEGIDETAPEDFDSYDKELDDLDALKQDIGDVEFILDDSQKDLVLPDPEEVEEVSKVKSDDDEKNEMAQQENPNPEIIPLDSMEGGQMAFDIGQAEKNLLSIAQTMQGQIPDSEWNEVTTAGGVTSYEVVKDDWLWKISQRLFGSGFYYPKIWSLNPYITNPHEIEPGMVLSFTTGHQDALPQFGIMGKKLFEIKKKKEMGLYSQFGDGAIPDWMKKREELKGDGKYIQYSSGDTLKDLEKLAQSGLNKEYESYTPPRPDYLLNLDPTEYDNSGVGIDTRIEVDFKQGFYLTTFISSNIVQDFGYIDSAIEEKNYFSQFDKLFIKIDKGVNPRVGDQFSTYINHGEVDHPESDRKGERYSVTGTLRLVQRHGDLWECDLTENTGLIKRGDRITVYTPAIERITKTFNSRRIEGLIVAGHDEGKTNLSLGDVLYIDRGRADGVELGNVFNVYGKVDRGTGVNITENPTYVNGEVTVLTLTDNFSTVLVTRSIRDFYIGDLVITKSKLEAAKVDDLKNRLSMASNDQKQLEGLDELDVELDLSNAADDLLNKADRIEFTDDELAELERREREKSILSENEKDLQDLAKLENEIETAQNMMDEAKLDQDRLLEDESLEQIEKRLLYNEQNSVEEMEEKVGKKYLDENLNDKDNPYGLTEFDIEEVDELLNLEVQEEAEKAAEGEEEVIDLLQ